MYQIRVGKELEWTGLVALEYMGLYWFREERIVEEQAEKNLARKGNSTIILIHGME